MTYEDFKKLNNNESISNLGRIQSLLHWISCFWWCFCCVSLIVSSSTWASWCSTRMWSWWKCLKCLLLKSGWSSSTYSPLLLRKFERYVQDKNVSMRCSARSCFKKSRHVKILIFFFLPDVYVWSRQNKPEGEGVVQWLFQCLWLSGHFHLLHWLWLEIGRRWSLHTREDCVLSQYHLLVRATLGYSGCQPASRTVRHDDC